MSIEEKLVKGMQELADINARLMKLREDERNLRTRKSELEGTWRHRGILPTLVSTMEAQKLPRLPGTSRWVILGVKEDRVLVRTIDGSIEVKYSAKTGQVLGHIHVPDLPAKIDVEEAIRVWTAARTR